MPKLRADVTATENAATGQRQQLGHRTALWLAQTQAERTQEFRLFSIRSTRAQCTSHQTYFRGAVQDVLINLCPPMKQKPPSGHTTAPSSEKLSCVLLTDSPRWPRSALGNTDRVSPSVCVSGACRVCPVTGGFLVVVQHSISEVHAHSRDRT